MSTERTTLAYIDLTNFKGLFTKSNPDLLKQDQLTVCKNVDFFTEYGSARRVSGNRRVLSSKIEEGGSGAPLSWVGFYKSQDFAGQIVRETLIQAGTKIFKVDGTSVTELASGQPSGLKRTHSQFDKFLLITGQDPYITGTLGDRYMFNGFHLANWGIEAPGNIETIIESFDTSSGFTTSGCSVATETSIAYSSSSLKVTKSTGVDTCYVEKTGMTNFNINSTVEDRARMYVYIPEDMYRKLRTSDRCFSIYFSALDDFDAPTASWVRYDFRIGQLLRGWNTLTFDFTVFPSGDLGSSKNSADFVANLPMDAVRYEWFFDPTYNAETVDVYMDHLVSLDVGAPTATMTGAGGTVFLGGVDQTWSYVVTYVNENGHESNQGVSQSTSIYGDASTVSTNTLWRYEDAGDGALSYTNANNPSLDNVNYTEADNSIQFGHAAGATTTAIAVTNQSFDISEAVSSYLYVDVWIAAGVRDNLATDGLRVQVGDSALNNYHEWRFDSTDITEDDFTTLIVDLSNPDSTEGTIDLSDIDNINVIFEFKDTAVTAADTALKVDYLRIEEVENYSSIELTNVPVSDDPAVVKRNIYRTVANGVTHFFVGAINDNTTTTFSDTVSDGALGTTQPPQPGQFFDNTVPPNAGIVKTWKRTVFMAGDPKDPNILYFSSDDNPESFPLINAFELDSPITGIFETRNGLIVTTDTDYWRVIGDNPDYYVDKVMRNMGNVGFRACGESKLYGWAHDRDSIRLYDLQDTNRFSEPIGDILIDLDKSDIENTWSIYSKAINQILFVYPNSGGVYGYQHSVDDIRSGWWIEFDLPSGLNLLCGEEIEDEDGNFMLYVGGDDGMLYEFLTGGNNSWVDADGTESAITMELQSIYLRAGALAAEVDGMTGRWFPTFIEVRSREESGAAHNYTVRIDSADGSANDQTVRDTQTLAYAFPANVNLQRYRPKDFTGAEYGRINIQCSDLNKDVYLQGIRLSVKVRAGQFTVFGTTFGGRS